MWHRGRGLCILEKGRGYASCREEETSAQAGEAVGSAWGRELDSSPQKEVEKSLQGMEKDGSGQPRERGLCTGK